MTGNTTQEGFEAHLKIKRERADRMSDKKTKLRDTQQAWLKSKKEKEVPDEESVQEETAGQKRGNDGRFRQKAHKK